MVCPVRMASLGCHSRRSLREGLFLDLSCTRGKRHQRSRLKSWCCETAGGQTDSTIASTKRVLLSPCSFKDYSPTKRQRFTLQLEDGKDQSVSISDAVIKARSPNISFISCAELASLICECSLADQRLLKQPIILDVRRQSSQACVHIRGAICMPCESCVKLRLLLPLLDKQLSSIFGERNCDLNPNSVRQSKRLLVICTDMTPDRMRSNSGFLTLLITHLEREFAGTVNVLEGNEIDGTSEQVLQSCHIRSVLNVTPKVPFLDETRFCCRRLVASDRETQDLRPFFNSAFEFIEESRCSGKAVLVHCQAGISRSPALVIAYLMAHSDLSLREAYRLVKSKRSVISPNFAFLGQLFEFEADLMTGRVVRKAHILSQFIMDNPPSPSTQLSYDSADDLISMAFSTPNS
ncbi:dual specificity phosphatase 10 [Paragonimus westermani]|uniref:protein-tyrosine-phosphatase n=1 Tax=Paragonimus westermani TaxID=34504 RepID=A0A5J4NWB3_9TREM|nr:dual specificity phosphatase 10 [Paragonimus westermani]